MGAPALGTPNTHHFEKLSGVSLLSNAMAAFSASLHACPVPLAVPPSVLSRFPGSPQTFGRPSPPHVSGATHVPHDATVREVPQLSLVVIRPQVFALRKQNAA